MLKHVFMTVVILVTLVLTLPVESTVNAMDSYLVGILTKSLGVTNKQAEGGAGAIFKEASKKLSVEDFAKVTDALPEVSPLMKAAPASDAKMIDSLSSTLGKAGGSVSSLAGLASSFSQLGLSPDMVQKYLPLILDYAESKGGDTVANLLKGALQ